MNWALALKAAAGVSSLLGFASFVAVLYFWREAARKYPSIKELIGDERVSDRQIVKILREFKDEHRLNALALLLGENRAKELLDKIKGNLDPIALEIDRNRDYARRFAVLLSGLLVIAILSVIEAMKLSTPSPLQQLADKIDYQNVETNQDAIASLAGMALLNANEQERDEIVATLKEKLRHPSTVQYDAPGRAVRKALLEAIVKVRNHDLRKDFLDGQLSNMDLVEVDLSNVNAQGVKFSGAFLIGTDFRGADLRGADFSSTFLRNVQFESAQLRSAVFSEADWFNARGLTTDQMSVVAKNSIKSCPADFIAFADAHYGVPYVGWTTEERANADNSWAEYTRPGGLCDWAKRAN